MLYFIFHQNLIEAVATSNNMRACQRKLFGSQHLDAESVEFFGKNFMKHTGSTVAQMVEDKF